MSGASNLILILDSVCPKPYCAESLEKEPLGGTEATVIRVAEALAEAGYEVHVAQHNRTGLPAGAGKANYTSFEALEAIARDPQAIIALRSPNNITQIRKTWGPKPKLFLWAHDFNQQDFVRAYKDLSQANTKIIAVSRTHKSVIADALLNQVRDITGVTIDFVYNPIADNLRPDDSTVYHRHLVYFSSPHKGLEQTLHMFGRVRALDPTYKLFIANPGYLGFEGQLPEGVENLGSLPHAEMIKQLRSAFAVFHMNMYPETFGLVYAEALAVGTPILTGCAVSAYEIIREREFFVNVQDEKAVIERLEKWQRDGRPQTEVNEAFRLSNVIRKWKELIG